MVPNIFMADLRYNYCGVLANDCMPLGVAYMKAVMDRDLPGEVRSRLFTYPDKLLEEMNQRPPEVLMVSNYVWNEALSLHMARIAKRMNPRMLVVMGGPNISLEPERQSAWLDSKPEVDLYVLGEGDFLATEVVRRYLAVGLDKERLLAGEIPSSLYRRPGGEIYRCETWDRHNQIDEIPSPWLTGIQDEFFDGKLAPMVETNRGCPFTCTFCVQGTRWYTKVHNFTVERVKEEIEYIARRAHKVCPSVGTLRIADSNYGMFERDVEISEFIGEMMKKYHYPRYIDATTGKNRPDRIIRSVEKVSGALVIYQAVQSLNDEVLKNVKRQTIKLEAYEQLQVHMRGRGLRSNSDLILGLPGETLETHLAAFSKLLDSGISQVTSFQLMMLKGSELETLATRNMFKFESRYRVLAKNFWEHEGERDMDVEEVIVATDTLSFNDYVTCRKHTLCGVAFWRDDSFEDVIRFLCSLGLKRSECWRVMLPELEASLGATRQYLDSFVAETVGELFPTPEAVKEFYSREENWTRLLAGEIGDNLMHKYHAMASFIHWPEISAIAMRALRKLAEERGLDRQIPEFDEFWANLADYVRLRHAHGLSEEAVFADQSGTFIYDISSWLEDEMPADVSRYRLAEPSRVNFRLSPEGREGLEGAFRVYTFTVKGLTKLVNRIQRSWQVRVPEWLGQTAAVAGD
ncbi:MAG: radical SAM protein [Bryobacterales bacterium]|nr:radical SAM protein [Bryobacterales bacterium]